MAIFEIEANGRKFRVEAPDAAAAAQAATAYAVPPTGDPQKLSGQPAAGAPMPAPAPALPIVPEQYRGGKVQMQNLDNSLSTQMDEVPWYKQAAAGFGSAPVQAYQGIKQLFGGKVNERDIRDQRDITSTGAGAIGNIAGNLAMLAVPGGLAEKGVRGAAMLLPKALQFLKYGTVPAVAAAETALTRPTVEGESRWEEAAKSALMAGVVGTGIKAAGRAYTGMAKSSKLGKELMDQGIQPSVAEGSEGLVGKAIGFGEDLLSTLGYKKGHSLANEQAMAKIKEEVTPLLKKFGHEEIAEPISRKSGFFEKAHENFLDSYSSILDNKKVPLPSIFRSTTLKRAAADVPEAADETVAAFQKRMAQIYTGARKGDKSATQWKSILNDVAQARREAMETAGTERSAKNLAQLYGSVEKSLMERAQSSKALTNTEMEALGELGIGWGKLKLVESAALIPRGGTGALAGKPGERLVSVDDIITASERSAPDAQRLGEKEFFAKTTRPMSEVLARNATRGTLGRQLAYGVGSAAGLGGVAATAGIPVAAGLGVPLLLAGAIGNTKAGAKVMMGNTAHQRRVAEMLRKNIDPRLGTIAASFDTDENEE